MLKHSLEYFGWSGRCGWSPPTNQRWRRAQKGMPRWPPGPLALAPQAIDHLKSISSYSVQGNPCCSGSLTQPTTLVCFTLTELNRPGCPEWPKQFTGERIAADFIQCRHFRAISEDGAGPRGAVDGRDLGPWRDDGHDLLPTTTQETKPSFA